MIQHRSSVLLPVALFSMLPLMGGAFGLGYLFRDKQDNVSKEKVELVRACAQKIKDRYVGSVDEARLFEGAIDGMVSTLDPYCEFFTAKEWEEFNSVQLEGKFGGVGILVELDRESGYLRVVTPIEDSPAFEEDILPGDLITAVDGKTVKGKSLRAIVDEIRGEPGTKVKLSMFRKGKDPFTVTLTRAIVKIQSVRYKVLPGDIGYIRISDFTRMMDAFDDAVADLQKKKIKALIIDLRFNGGGLLQECVKLSDRFLPKGAMIVSTRGRTSDDNRRLEATDGDDLPKWPLVVLVNEGTASASEIFAGAMKDHSRGVLVGAKTFGKGSVQTPFRMPDNSHLKLTTAKYFTPSGYSVQKSKRRAYGLMPDYLIELTPEENLKLLQKWRNDRIRKGDPKESAPTKFRDIQLEAGLEVLNAKLAGREPKVETRELSKNDKKSDD